METVTSLALQKLFQRLGELTTLPAALLIFSEICHQSQKTIRLVFLKILLFNKHIIVTNIILQGIYIFTPHFQTFHLQGYIQIL